ncbi:MAG: hypothetical protein GKC00_05860 [Candidatus Methanofastidiosa archaeon]|nr:hypothetical protein [Candidatus Methanofastidiosa archaeon]
MFRKTSRQLSLLEPEIIVPNILPANDWSYIYQEKIYPRIDENKFKHLYQERGGAPNKSIKKQVSVLIFMGIEVLNWREAEFQFERRIDWMNATHTPFGAAKIDHTTLFKFYQRLEKDDTAYKFFRDLTDTFIKECNVSTKKQRVDSFFMYGWLEKLSRYGLFKETNRSFLQVLRKHKPGLYEKVKSELSRDYLEKDFDLTEKDKAKATRKIKEMAQDLYILKKAFENHKQIKHYESFKILATVFEQQCIVKEEKEESPEVLPEIEIREKPIGGKIISSPHNPDAVYTRKRDQKVVGHKGFVTETCGSENEVQYITDANLEKATHSDTEEAPKIEERLEDNGFKPEELNGDAGFVNGKTILESERKGIDLVGPSAGRSQSIENFEREDRPLDIADFKVEIDETTKELQVLLCPNKQEPLDQKRSNKKDHILVHFDKDACTQCPLHTRCPVKIGVNISTLTVNEEQYAGAARHHHYMNSPDYRKKCAVRAGAESLVNEIANSHGARRSKHKTEERSRLQLIFASIACNVKRFIRYKVECVQNQAKLAGATV